MRPDNIYVKLLKRAYELIEQRRQAFTCCAITAASKEFCTQTDGTWLRHRILGSLDGTTTLETWLLINHGIDYVAAGADAMRAHRLLWIKQMIEEWKDAP